MSSSSTLPEIHQRVADQVKILIDKGHLSAPYIEIYESFSNDSNVFYYISNSDSPGSENAELPSRVLEYKGRYFCFIELDEPEMTRTELFERESFLILIFRKMNIWVIAQYIGCLLFGNMKMYKF